MSTEKHPEDAAGKPAADAAPGDSAATARPGSEPEAAGVGAGAAPDPAPWERTEPAADAPTEPSPASSAPESPPDLTSELPAQSATPAAAAAAPPPPQKGGGWTGPVLFALVLLIAGAVAGARYAPALAGWLPGPVAAFFAPAEQGGDAAAVAELQSRLAALEARADEATSAGETAIAAATGAAERLAELDGRLAAVEQAPPAAGGNAVDPALAGRVDELAAAVAALEQRAEALAGDVAGLGSNGVDQTALAAVRDEVAALRAAVPDQDALNALRGELAGLRERLTAAESGLEAERAAREGAVAAAQQAREALSLGAALTEIDRALLEGAPFAEALGDASAAVGAPAPEPLTAVAETGVASREALKVSFSDAAYGAIRASLQAEAGDSPLGGLLAGVEARFTGLPAEPEEGDDAQAVLSRARAALLGGDLDGAISILDALPPESVAAMADWKSAARARIAAESALADWRASLGPQ